jgi:transaldolase
VGPAAELAASGALQYRVVPRDESRGPAAHVEPQRAGEDVGKTDEILSRVKTLSELKVRIFADGADKATMLALYANPLIRGFTTNPTLMRKAGITDYEGFARDILQSIPDRPLSLEVFADEFPEMERQARKIAAWGDNVYVKIPVTNTRGEPSLDLICRLAHAGVKLNVTALLTLDQVRDVSQALDGGAPSCVSIFAGRIADTGQDPVPVMAAAVEMLRAYPRMELIWASPRELLNIFQADDIGCHIITATPDILKKLSVVGRNLDDYSLETVKMFHDDAKKSGYTL